MTGEQLERLALLIAERLLLDHKGLRNVAQLGRCSDFAITETKGGAVLLDLKFEPDDAVVIMIREERPLR